MTPGHNLGASAEFAFGKGRETSASGGPVRALRWRGLDPDRRLQLIDHVLRTTDGLVDDFSLAL